MNPIEPTKNNGEQIRRHYQEHVDCYQRMLDSIDRQSRWMSRLRGLTFLPVVVLVIVGWASSENSSIWFSGAGAFFLGFVALAGFHEHILRQATQIKHRRNMNRTQLARLDRNWRQLPAIAVELPEVHRAVSRDLDLFGRASLFQLVSLAHTPFGKETLRDWLLEPAGREEIAARQEAVSILAKDERFREELDLRGRMLVSGAYGPQAFVEWAEGPPWLRQRRWLKWLVRSLLLGIIALVVAGMVGLIGAETAWFAFLAILVVNIGVSVAFTGSIHEIFDKVTSRNDEIRHYRQLFESIANLPESCEFFRVLRSNMGKSTHEPMRLLNHLMRVMRFANLRRDSLFGIPYLVSQIIFLTDFHVLYFLEIWQHRHGRVVRRWLDTVGQLEAISSLATLAHDHPDWTLPSVQDHLETEIKAKQVGHPLLADNACVRNDVQIGPSGTFLLVTGSNMSGKSTLLRAIGVNVSLAQAGGSVCAAEFRLPPVKLATSMRVDDSLEDGVSFFMAELKRLKQIVDQSREQRVAADRTLLYLLDEILQGTNSAERHIAVSKVIGHLIANRSIGAVSTHDLELADSPSLSDICEMVHFRETFVGNADESTLR